MTLIKSIAIEKPCNQTWQQMTEERNGRYCGHCCKTVVDFTRMTDVEIINYLSAKNDICGRFEYRQINEVNHELYVDNLKTTGWRNRMIIAIVMLGSLSFYRASGQIKQPIDKNAGISRDNNNIKTNGFMLGKVVKPASLKYHLIKGKVIGKDDGLPLPGATVKLKHKDIGTQCDIYGNFMLNTSLDTADVLVVSFVGFTTQEIELGKNIRDSYDIALEPPLKINPVTLGMVVVKRRSVPKTIWYKIKKIF